MVIWNWEFVFADFLEAHLKISGCWLELDVEAIFTAWMMAKCFTNSLPRISEENETNGKVMAAEPTVPRIQKVHWTDENISQDWLKRLSSIKTSAFAIKPGINLINTKSIQVMPAKDRPKQWSIKSCSQENVNKLGDQSLEEGCKGNSVDLSLYQSLQTNSLKTEAISRRQPDSTYILLVNGIVPPNTSCLQHFTQSRSWHDSRHRAMHA